MLSVAGQFRFMVLKAPENESAPLVLSSGKFAYL